MSGSVERVEPLNWPSSRLYNSEQFQRFQRADAMISLGVNAVMANSAIADFGIERTFDTTSHKFRPLNRTARYTVSFTRVGSSESEQVNFYYKPGGAFEDEHIGAKSVPILVPEGRVLRGWSRIEHVRDIFEDVRAEVKNNVDLSGPVTNENIQLLLELLLGLQQSNPESVFGSLLAKIASAHFEKPRDTFKAGEIPLDRFNKRQLECLFRVDPIVDRAVSEVMGNLGVPNYAVTSGFIESESGPPDKAYRLKMVADPDDLGGGLGYDFITIGYQVPWGISPEKFGVYDVPLVVGKNIRGTNRGISLDLALKLIADEDANIPTRIGVSFSCITDRDLEKINDNLKRLIKLGLTVPRKSLPRF